jgi:hypothetical protein
MRRRPVGVGAVKDWKTGQEKYKEKSTSMQENLVEEVFIIALLRAWMESRT